MAMANFIKNHSLAGALMRQNWTDFAHGYNGAKSKEIYAKRLAAAHAKYRTLLPDVNLRQAQVALLYLGFNPGDIDGIFGKRTKSALSDFQTKNSLASTGSLDSSTEKELTKQAFT